MAGAEEWRRELVECEERRKRQMVGGRKQSESGR